MSEQNQPEDGKTHGLTEKIFGIGQAVIGEIEIIGGVLTGDPITRAEGEFNVEIGNKRQEIEAEIERNEGGE